MDAKTIPLNPVSSSNVAAIGYDEKSETLVVEFLNGAKYAYSDIELPTWEALRDASSIGSYLAQNIKGKYLTVRI
jgi:hypothetical protein